MTLGSGTGADETGTAAEIRLSGPRRALHVFILSGFGVAQPVLDLLSRHTQFFVAHDSRPVDLIVLTLILCLLPPALLCLVELIPSLLSQRAGRSMHSVLIAFLAAGGILPFLRWIDHGPGWLWLLTAMLLGIAAATAADHFAFVRGYLTWFWPAPLMFAVAFLLLTPVRDLVFPAPYVSTVDVDVAAETPVVIVVFDELALPTLMDENHQINPHRYPNFALLSQRSHWFRNATTTAAYTPVAVPALLSGRLKGEGGGNAYLATAKRHPRTLFSLLAPEYQLHVFETTTSVCPRDLCGPALFDNRPLERLSYLLADLSAVYPHAVLPADMSHELPDITNRWSGFNNLWRTRWVRARNLEAGRKPQTFADFLATMRSGERRALHFLHSSLPHVPWRYTASGKNYNPFEGGFTFNHGIHRETWGHNEFSVLQAFQRYLLQLRFTDRLVGDLITTLEKTGLWDDTLLVVTADHGVSFHAGEPRRRLKASNFFDVLTVPLFIKLPHQREGLTSDRNVELVDVLPTIAAALGINEPPWPMDGQPIFDPSAPERRHKTVFVTPFMENDFRTFEAADFETKYQAVERMLADFGSGEDPLDLYRIGPHPELIGRQVDTFQTAAETDGEFHLKRPDLYDDVDPESDLLPARVVGEIRGSRHRRGALDLAITINGTVWATTRTYDHRRGRARFTAMVPDQAFNRGRNDVRAFILESQRDAPVLRPTRRPLRATGA